MDYINYLTQYQVSFLDSYKPIYLWEKELISYFELNDFDFIAETLASYNKFISYEEFHYIGYDPINLYDDDDPNIILLIKLQTRIYNKCKNHYYRILTRIIIKDYKIGINTCLNLAINMLNKIYENGDQIHV